MKIHDLVDEYKKTATGRKKIMPLLKKCYPGRYDNMDVDEFIELHNNSKLEDVYCFKVGCFSKYTPEKIQKLMDYLGVSMQSDVYLPETDMTDLEELKSVLTPEEYQEAVSKMEGKFAYFPHTEEDIRTMLQRIGVRSLDDLYSDVPSDFIFKGEYDLPDALSEQQVRDFFESLASKNSRLKVLVGQGAYDHYVRLSLSVQVPMTTTPRR